MGLNVTTTRKVVSTAVFLLVVALCVAPLSASVWTQNISYDGIEDLVQDNSVSTAILDTGGPLGTPDGIVSVGDIVVGLIKWNLNISDSNPFEDHAIAVFAAEVSADNGAGVGVGPDPSINFSLASTTGSLAALSALLPATVVAHGALPLGSVAVLLSSTVVTPDPTTQAFAIALANVNANFAADAIIGIAPGSLTDYFEAELRDLNPTGAATPDGVITITDTNANGFRDEWDDAGRPGGLLASGSLIGAESGAFTVLADFTGPGPAAYLPLFGNKLDGTPTGPAHVILTDSTTLSQPTPAQAANGYAFADNAFIRVNATPEPTSVIVWTALAAFITCRAGRRRN